MPQPSAFEIALRPSVLKRAALIAAIVGTLLACINHGDKVVLGTFDSTSLLQIGLTYCVPFSVSLVSSILAVLDK